MNTEAATNVFEYITKHQHEQTRADSDADKDLLKTFETTSNAIYHKGSIVFDIDGSSADLWIQCLKKKVGEPVDLADGTAVIMKKYDLLIPLIPNKSNKNYFGSIFVTVYPNPKTSNPKIMIQGKMYLAFVSFILPVVIKDIKKATMNPLSKDTASVNSDEEDEPCPSSDMETLNKSLKRMETEVLNMREDLIDKVDTGARTNDNLVNRLDTIENLLKKNIEQNTNLSQTMEKFCHTVKSRVENTNISLQDDQLERLAQNVGNTSEIKKISDTLSLLRYEVAKTTTLERVQAQVVGMSSILSEVHSTSTQIDRKVDNFAAQMVKNSNTSNQEIKQLRENSVNSLDMFKAMKDSLETIATKPNTTQTIPPLIL